MAAYLWPISILFYFGLCTGNTLVPYWIVEIHLHSFTVLLPQTRSLESYLDSVAHRLALTSLGRVGSLANVYELNYPSGEKGINYSKITQALRKEKIFIRVEQQEILPYDLRTYHLPTDPEFKNQWPWFNTGQTGGPMSLDINVVPVWIQGVTGSGSTVAVIDDGVQVTHPDLKSNIDLSISYSFITNSNNPSPILTVAEFSHGTNCAGEIVMVTDNDICGTGVAYNAKLGGIQFLLSDFRPAQQATALFYKNNEIQVYSNSYGPSDDGFTVSGPGIDSIQAIDTAVKQGRNNLGSVYVFSSGNGGENGDSCAADGFINNRHIIGVGSANENGYQAYYDENCSGKMATTYTYNGNSQSNNVVTTFVSSECFSNFTGTSASAPLVSGVIALGLEVNPDLSWRDIQYLIVYTSDSSRLMGNWITNGAGLRVSSQFGFGAIDAEAFVNRARHWKSVDDASKKYALIFDKKSIVNQSHPYNIEFTISDTSILYLEHVIFTVTFGVEPIFSDTECYKRDDFAQNPDVINHLGAKRGDAQIIVCSPAGTCSELLPKRPKDFINCEGYDNWNFMSVHFWAENPVGNWSLSLTFDSDAGNAILEYLSISLYGINSKPESVQNSCNSTCKRPTGCSFGGGSNYCDSCAEGFYRNISTMECVDTCSPGACIIANTCVFYNGTCPKFIQTSSSVDQIIIIAGVFAGVVGVLLSLTCVMCVAYSLCSKQRKRNYKKRMEIEGEDYFQYDEVNGHD